MKRLSIVVCLLMCIAGASAQHQVNSFFNKEGTARLKTTEYSGSGDTIVTTEHRLDDIIWSRVVYRVIDLRFKQNYQLYFPQSPNDPNYRNLLKVIADAVVDGMPIYEGHTIRPPEFGTTAPMEKSEIALNAYNLAPPGAEGDDIDNIATSDYMLFHCDTVNNVFEINTSRFKVFSKNQIKYLIQEILFFDKHTSRLHSKIMAIAPINPELTSSDLKVMDALELAIQFWIPFDELRPYLAKQYVTPLQNETKRVTYDDFFQKRLYTSYIIGDENIYNRMIPEYATGEEAIKKEQKRIENELLSFELDLWEY